MSQPSKPFDDLIRLDGDSCVLHATMMWNDLQPGDAEISEVLWTILLYSSISAWQSSIWPLTDLIHNHLNRQANIIRGLSPLKHHICFWIKAVFCASAFTWIWHLIPFISIVAQRFLQKLIFWAHHVPPSALSSGSGVDFGAACSSALGFQAGGAASTRSDAQTRPAEACCCFLHVRV